MKNIIENKYYQFALQQFADYDAKNIDYFYTVTLEFSDGAKLELVNKTLQTKGADNLKNKLKSIEIYPDIDVILITEYVGKKNQTYCINLTSKEKPEDLINKKIDALNEKLETKNGLNGPEVPAWQIEINNLKHEAKLNELSNKIRNLSEANIKLQNEIESLTLENEEIQTEIENYQNTIGDLEKLTSTSKNLTAIVSGIVSHPAGKNMLNKIGLSGLGDLLTVDNNNELLSDNNSEQNNHPYNEHIINIDNYLKTLSEDSFKMVYKVFVEMSKSKDTTQMLYELVTEKTQAI